ncbi:cystatin-A isoform X1 [Penaeus vannamei]|uniref:cystatin-A isoform X1 n=1 Tax=Penaeus vannamei TaxID=6689 RepID=UPI00387F4141
MMMAGGISDAKPFSEEVQQLLEAVKSELEEKLGKKLDRFQLVSYKTQVVAGTNYFAKSFVCTADGHRRRGTGAHARVQESAGGGVAALTPAPENPRGGHCVLLSPGGSLGA